MTRVYLSPPHVSDRERTLLLDAFESNWIAPLGPHVDAFEREVSDYVGIRAAAALSSGTAALHLALELLGVKQGDTVCCSTLTFAATANAIRYCGADPIFIDCDAATWNMDPVLLEEELDDCSKKSQLPKAAIVVDLYGNLPDYTRILDICARYGVPVVEDAAEALGSEYRGQKAGRFGDIAILSFNGNKILTTSGGGMLLSDNEAYVEQARFLATQARDPAPHYEHSVVGYNYRMSNLLAAVGRGQLEWLDERVRARRQNFDRYAQAFAELPGINLAPETEGARTNRWLTCITVDPETTGTDRETLRIELERLNIEARPIWKPMHIQPVFARHRRRGGAVSEHLFQTGLCLPSGSSLSARDQYRVIESIVAGVTRSRSVADAAYHP